MHLGTLGAINGLITEAVEKILIRGRSLSEIAFAGAGRRRTGVRERERELGGGREREKSLWDLTPCPKNL